MATRTTNYGLYKPDPTDNFGDFLSEFNDNMDEIDGHLGGGGGSGNVDDVQVNGVSVLDPQTHVAEITSYKEATQAQYDALPSSKLTDGIAYFIKDGGGGSGSGGSFLLMITAETGETVTATKDGTTLTATEVSTGVYEVEVTSAGTWTISDGTNTATVDVGIYTATLSSVPEGSTVLPTDDISIWLACGERTEGYTTLSQVLGDSVCLLALLNNNNANDYLVRSTTWASTITADSSAMSYIGLNNYCANTLLADSTWREAICNSEYFESVLNVKVPVMTSNTTPSGECYGLVVGELVLTNSYYPYGGQTLAASVNKNTQTAYTAYRFSEAISVGKVTGKTARISKLKIQGGSNNSGYEDISPELSTGATSDGTPIAFSRTISPAEKYDSYRVIATEYNFPGGNTTSYINFSEIQFYGRKDV